MDNIFVLVFGNSDLIKDVLIMRTIIRKIRTLVKGYFLMLKRVVVQFLDSWIEKTHSKIFKASPYTARK